MSGIPPTGIAATVGLTGGVTAGDYQQSVTFYTAVFGVFGIPPVEDADFHNTTFGPNFAVREQNNDTNPSVTTGADIFIQAPVGSSLDAVQAALGQAGFDNLGFARGKAQNPPRIWVNFPDPDGNTVWVSILELAQPQTQPT